MINIDTKIMMPSVMIIGVELTLSRILSLRRHFSFLIRWRMTVKGRVGFPSRWSAASVCWAVARYYLRLEPVCVVQLAHFSHDVKRVHLRDPKKPMVTLGIMATTSPSKLFRNYSNLPWSLVILILNR